MVSITQLNSEELVNINGGNLWYDVGYLLGGAFHQFLFHNPDYNWSCGAMI